MPKILMRSFYERGTESDNTAIIQTALKRRDEGRHLITTMIEHEAVLKPMAFGRKMATKGDLFTS